MLTDAKARRIKPTDKAVSVGGVPGLYLKPSKQIGHGKFILRYTSPETGKRRDMGLGTYPAVSLAKARELAFEQRQILSSGSDPIHERQEAARKIKAVEAIPTFEHAAREAYEDKVVGFKNLKHRKEWIRTLERFAFPEIGSRRVSELAARDFAEVLKPIWLEIPETASRVRQRMDCVMDWCAAHDHVIASPVKAVDHVLPKQPSKRTRMNHHPAVAWRDLPAVSSQLFSNDEMSCSAQALFFAILTCARSGEVRHMTWSEIDFEKRIWTIPADRMKTGVRHRVPLSASASSLLVRRRMFSTTDGYVFWKRIGKPLSDMSLAKPLKYNKVQSDTPGRLATVHGFRSTFRDWASENGYQRDLAERALAHSIKNQTEAAYHRTDLLEQRRGMMDAWADWVTSQLLP